MKATWLAPFALALAATPALANDMDTDTDNGQMQDGQMQQSTSPDRMSDGMDSGDTDQDGQMSRHSDDMEADSDMDTDNGELETGTHRDSDMRLEKDSDTDTDT